MVYAIKTYETANGRKPVKEFINDFRKCPREESAIIYDELRLLREHGYHRTRDNDKYKPIKSAKGLHELTVDKYRLFYSHCQENVLMFYHIYKKTSGSNKRQDQEIKIAEKRMIEYQQSGICK